MRRVWLAALLAAGSLALAGQASAAIMQANWGGGFDDNPMYGGWALTVVYDTSLATEINPAPDSGHALTWDISSGTPSPVLSLSGTVFGRTNQAGCCYFGPFPVPDQPFAMTDFTSFTLEQGGFEGYRLMVSDGAQFVDIGNSPGPSTNPVPLVPFNIDYDLHINDIGFWNLHGVTAGDPFTEQVAVRVLSIPEPATWALMLTGFFGLGAALRRRRAAFA